MPLARTTPSALLARAAQVLLIAGCLAVVAVFALAAKWQVTSGFFLLAFAVGLVHPWYALTGVVLLAPLGLMGPGSTHRLAHTEFFVLGALCGHAVRHLRARGDASPDFARHFAMDPGYGRTSGAALAHRADGSDALSPTASSPDAGLWPYLGWALVFGILATLVPGLQVGYASPEPQAPVGGWLAILWQALYGYPTHPWWPSRAAYNWLTGLAVCWMAYRWTNVARARALLVYAALALAVACVAALGERFGLWTFDLWRRPNPDDLHRRFQRLAGLAGHAGWKAEWILVAWPGALLLWGNGRKRRLLVAALLVLYGFTLLLTLARAAWLGAILAAAVLACLHYRPRTFPWKLAGAAGLTTLLLLGATALVASDSFLFRLTRLTDIRDRLNYVASTLHLLRESPLGFGLGMHSLVYEARFVPFHRFWQFDHATAHNTWLHLLVEQGPLTTGLIALGAAGIVFETARGWRRAAGDPARRHVLACLLLVFAALSAESLAQYLPMLRVVEVTVWALVGCAIRLARETLPDPATALRSTAHGEATAHPANDRSTAGGDARSAADRPAPGNRLGTALLLTAGVLFCFIGWHHARRNAAEPFPRALVSREGPPASVETWTTETWRFPLEAKWAGIEFTLAAGMHGQEAVVRVPDNPPWHLRLAPGESRGAWFEMNPPANTAGRFARVRWLEIDSARPWVPAQSDPESTDRRRLGVYVYGLRPLYADDDPRRPETQRWRQGMGGMPRKED